MPICPECNEEIEELGTHSYGNYTTYYKVYIEHGAIKEEEEGGEKDMEGSVGYSCPKCYAELFTNEEDAEDFLKEYLNGDLIDKNRGEL